ncbi:hypothetical protein K08M3_37420 [Vibrio alginolyticus]|jgi:hypothetical protein|uniref:Uncharacterized protein n=1 Tax=Vibrio alginolyticus TaxID=663 RepID=A0A1W6THV3_VIBAL|nr:hypothetical protein Vca1114GL_04605 [Vibrio campbellii]ARP00589.1 hypothetical protein K01M1_37570 [Vibrio alginolyticus]CAD7824148.1 hypothetical protein ACOMICROBIO_NCLOACGD_04437 [Vibrio sp. B1ASS3]SQA35594.1 Uncharacterised protein [Vibrio harveyi]SUP36883.1 Uncharacterised protein [Vibrio owensii]
MTPSAANTAKEFLNFIPIPVRESFVTTIGIILLGARL